MKKYLINLFSLFSLVSCIGGSNVVDNHQLKAMPEGQLLMVEVSEWGTMAEPEYAYMVHMSDDGQTLCTTYSHEHWSYVTYRVDAQLLSVLQTVIAEHKMCGYGHSYNNPNVLDGTSWHFEAKFENKQSISSGGTNAGPGDDGVGVIRAHCESAVKAGKFLYVSDSEGMPLPDSGTSEE